MILCRIVRALVFVAIVYFLGNSYRTHKLVCFNLQALHSICIDSNLMHFQHAYTSKPNKKHSCQSIHFESSNQMTRKWNFVQKLRLSLSPFLRFSFCIRNMYHDCVGKLQLWVFGVETKIGLMMIGVRRSVFVQSMHCILSCMHILNTFTHLLIQQKMKCKKHHQSWST